MDLRVGSTVNQVGGIELETLKHYSAYLFVSLR